METEGARLSASVAASILLVSSARDRVVVEEAGKQLYLHSPMERHIHCSLPNGAAMAGEHQLRRKSLFLKAAQGRWVMNTGLDVGGHYSSPRCVSGPER